MTVGGYRWRSEGLGRRRTPQVRRRKKSVVVNGISDLCPLNNLQLLLNRVSKIDFYTIQVVMKDCYLVDPFSIRVRSIESGIVLLFREKCSVHVPDLLASPTPVP